MRLQLWLRPEPCQTPKPKRASPEEPIGSQSHFSEGLTEPKFVASRGSVRGHKHKDSGALLSQAGYVSRSPPPCLPVCHADAGAVLSGWVLWTRLARSVTPCGPASAGMWPRSRRRAPLPPWTSSGSHSCALCLKEGLLVK